MGKRQTFRQRWVKALRSGRYKQGKGVLRSPDDQYCCLGVGLDLLDSDKWTKSAQAPGNMTVENPSVVGFAWGRKRSVHNWDACGLPPRNALDLLGISEAQATDLAEANDDGTTFDAIADALERQEQTGSDTLTYAQLTGY